MMPRQDDNVIPFRRKPRKWTRPEDYSPPALLAPPRQASVRRDWSRARRTLAVWALILLIIAATVAWSAWDLWG